MIQALIAKYSMQLMTILILILTVFGGYFYWKHGIIDKAVSKCNDAWHQRDIDTERQSIAIQSSENAKIAIIKQYQKEVYEKAIENYSSYIISLNADIDRMRDTKTASASSGKNRMPTKNSCPEATYRSSEEIISIKSCEILIEDFLIPNSEIK